jgi:hypothetical protein
LGDADTPLQISIRQNFRLNGEDHYTIFDMPISVTNRIDNMSDGRPSCDDLNNGMMARELVSAQLVNDVDVLFAPGDATQVEVMLPDGVMTGNNGIGGSRPQAGPQDGLGSGASLVRWRTGTHAIWALSIATALFA